MAAPRSLEGLLRDLEESESRTSFLHGQQRISPVLDVASKQKLAELEGKLREFAALIRERDKALDEAYREQRLSPIPASEVDGSPRLLTSADERQRNALQSEVTRLREELRTVNACISVYEQQLLTVHTQLQVLETRQSPSPLPSPLTDSTSLQLQITRAKSFLLSIQTENAQLRTTLIPALETELQDYLSKTDQVKTLLSTWKQCGKCNLAAGIWTQRTLNRPQSTVKSHGNDLVSKQNCTVSKPKPQYVPSFQRSKRPVKVQIKRKTAK